MESARRASVNCQALKILAVCPFPADDARHGGWYRVHDAGGPDADLLAQSVDEMSPAREATAMDRRRGYSAGFTLIEIMVVILILGLLATIVVQSLRGATRIPRRPSLIASTSSPPSCAAGSAQRRVAGSWSSACATRTFV
jgi:prepilin-type N-terminal cleavage/methylation domain-containing protein